MIVMISFSIIVCFTGRILSSTTAMKQMMKSVEAQDFLADVIPHLSTGELIRLHYDPPAGAYIKSTADELRKRVNSTSKDHFEDSYKEALLQMYDECKAGGQIAEIAKRNISEKVRKTLQGRIDANTQREGTYLSLGWTNRTGSGALSDKLFEALEFFGKSIFVPSSVRELVVENLGLTSMWLRLRKDSKIIALRLSGNKFEHLNMDTFGQYVGENGEKIKVLHLDGNSKIKEINLQSLPNLAILEVERCSSLVNIVNMPSSLTEFDISGTRIHTQAQFGSIPDGWKGFTLIMCDAHDRDTFLPMMEYKFPKWHHWYELGRVPPVVIIKEF